MRTETAALAGKVVAAIESPSTTPTHVAESPRAPKRMIASLVRTPHVLPPNAQVAPPKVEPPAAGDSNSAQSDTDVRVSENEPGSSPIKASPPPSVLPSGPSTATSQADAAAQAPRIAQAAPSKPQLQLAPSADTASFPPDVTPGSVTAVPNMPPLSTKEIALVEQRLKDNLTSEMFNNFELFLYVSKASDGPWSQRMFVFEKEPSGDLALAYNWLVSTGRESDDINPSGQKLPTDTPAGYYELDPHRFYPRYVSSQWGEKMPFAMFFNWQKDGEQTGLAIHSASGDDVGLLGKRASAGCVRLPPEAAKTLFNLIKTKYRGLAPRFAVDHRSGTMSNDGIILHDHDGHVQLADGYKVLVFIEDYGGENVVAAMY
jgi:lipoprotein-anchoring transpeptidase ErfK/SrfK